MERDTKALVLGLALWLLSTIAIAVATAHPRNFDLPPTSTDYIYHWAGIVGLFLLLIGSLAVGGAAVSFAGRFNARKAGVAGLLFVAPAVLYWAVSRGREVHSFAWVFLLLPWFVSILSGLLLLLVGASRAIVSKLRS